MILYASYCMHKTLKLHEHVNSSEVFLLHLSRPAESDLNRFGLNWAAVWVKMASSWVCVLIYLWTLIIPRCWMGRDLTFTRASQKKRKKEGEEGEGEHLNEVEGGEVIDSIESAV